MPYDAPQALGGPLPPFPQVAAALGRAGRPLGAPGLGVQTLTSRAGGDPENGQNVSLLACVANSETHIKIQFPKTVLWGPYFINFHWQQ